jgi:16S rRNA (guanine(966)-N(2))-methyltransferase RsmD
MLRQALFNILGAAVPDRPFFDLFAGTGAVGFEALSRGAAHVAFVERDLRAAADIERHLREFQVTERAEVIRADVYRWAERWPAGSEPVNIFLGPPYPDYQRRREALWEVLTTLQQKVVLQSERLPRDAQLPDAGQWKERRYGRNHLWFWVKGLVENAGNAEPA